MNREDITYRKTNRENTLEAKRHGIMIDECCRCHCLTHLIKKCRCEVCGAKQLPMPYRFKKPSPL